MFSSVIDWISEWWKFILGGFALVIIVVIAVIFWPEPMDHGTVTAKWHDPENTYWTTQCMTIMSSDGKSSRQQCYPVQVTDDEDWGFNLEDCTSADNDCKRGSREVSEEDWNAYEVGDYYDAR